ncbi:MAG: hypothetical protein KGL95_03750, partial [Patescibacteria group bacterium]|nr:hypothetical protein [Patescibacteria group bacterium]
VNTVMTAEDIEARLYKRGFTITPDTDIILGGEWQEVCVAAVAQQMLQLPQVRKVRIDKQASLTSEYYGPAERVPVRHENFYRMFGEHRGYKLVEDDRYFRIDRK